MFDVLSLTNHEDDVSGRKLPSKISLRSFKLYRVHSSQDCLPVPNCLLCVYVLHTTSQKEVLRRSRAVVVNTEMYQTKWHAPALPLFSWLPKFPDIEDTALILLFKIKDISSQKLAIDSIIIYYE